MYSLTPLDPEDIASDAYIVPSDSSNKRMQPAKITGVVFRKVPGEVKSTLCHVIRLDTKIYGLVPINSPDFKVVDHHAANYYCRDCSENTLDNAYYDQYMVTDGLWKKYGAGKGMLCVSCLQLRVGRQLTKTDFTDHPINTSNRFIKQIKASNHA